MNFHEYISRENLLDFIKQRSDFIAEYAIDIRNKAIRHSLFSVGGDKYKYALVFPGYLDRGEHMPRPCIFVAVWEKEALIVRSIIDLEGGQEDIHRVNRLTNEEIRFLYKLISEDEYYFPV